MNYTLFYEQAKKLYDKSKTYYGISSVLKKTKLICSFFRIHFLLFEYIWKFGT